VVLSWLLLCIIFYVQGVLPWSIRFGRGKRALVGRGAAKNKILLMAQFMGGCGRQTAAVATTSKMMMDAHFFEHSTGGIAPHLILLTYSFGNKITRRSGGLLESHVTSVLEFAEISKRVDQASITFLLLFGILARH